MADEKAEEPGVTVEYARIVKLIELVMNEGGRRVAYYYSQGGNLVSVVDLGPPATKGEGA